MQFQTIMDNLFLTFDSMVSASSFVELSSCVFAWVEEHCKPQVLLHFILLISLNLLSHVCRA